MVHIRSAFLNLLFFLLSGRALTQQPQSPPIPPSRCSLAMFENDANAYQACMAQWALQQNWYPDPIGGLFSYQTWNGFDGFWQNGVILEAYLN